jgi:hypothetical protein
MLRNLVVSSGFNACQGRTPTANFFKIFTKKNFQVMARSWLLLAVSIGLTYGALKTKPY